MRPRKAHLHPQSSRPVPGGNCPAHALGERAGDGQPQPGGAAPGLHGVEAVEQPPHLHLVQRRGGVGQGDGAVRRQNHVQIPGAVFQGVGQQVAQHPGQGGPVQAARHPLRRQGDAGDDACLNKRPIEGGHRLFHRAVQIHRLRGEPVLQAGGHRAAQQLLNEPAHGLRPAGDEGQVAGLPGGVVPLFQQLQIAADGGEGGAQVVGDVGDRLLQLPVAVLVPLALAAQLLELDVEPGRQPAGAGVPGG